MTTPMLQVQAPLPFDRSLGWTLVGAGLIVAGTVILCNVAAAPSSSATVPHR